MSGQTDFRVPVPEEVVERANEVARYLGATLPNGWGFGLMAFQYGSTPESPGAVMWISSAQREDMVLAMQEFIRKQGS